MRYRKRELVLLTIILFLSFLAEVRSQTARSGQPPVTADERLEARERLAELGYWLDPERDPPGGQFRQALIAFQKVGGHPRTGILTRGLLEMIRLAGRPVPLEAGEPHLEIDLYRQVLFVVAAEGEVVRVLPVSSGSGECFTEGGRTRRATTPKGRFTIQRRIEGWRKSALGLLYYPLYFHQGIAIHGNPAVPTRPASHGCIRIPIYAAIDLAGMTAAGSPVIVYDSNPNPPPAPGPCPTPTAQ